MFLQMWKSTVGVPLQVTDSPDDDWETDPDFENNVTEEEQRWGSKTIPGSGRIGDAVEYVILDTMFTYLLLLFASVDYNHNVPLA